MYRLGLGATIQDFASAITRFEGTCPSPTSCRNFNPGNLRAGPGQTGVDSRGIAVFPDYQTGESALEHQIGLNIDRGLTLDEFFGGKSGVYAGYAPAADSNDPGNYSRTVAGWLGIDPTAKLASVMGETTPIFDAGSAPDQTGWELPAEESGLSGVAMAGLGLAALAVVWAMTS
jgi:hypothetical protein